MTGLARHGASYRPPHKRRGPGNGAGRAKVMGVAYRPACIRKYRRATCRKRGVKPGEVRTPREFGRGHVP